MLAAVILTATLTSPSTYAGEVASSHRAESAHVRHLRHVAHLQYLHWRHLQEEARDRAEMAGHRHNPVPVLTSGGVPSGSTLTCSGLEHLWDAVGGNLADAFLAAEVARAESGGYQYATGPAGERGFWQIHPDHGSLSTYDKYGNARAAVIISKDGRDWSPWTTYVTGAYRGRCLGGIAAICQMGAR